MSVILSQMVGKSYSLKIVTNWLDMKGIKYVHCSGGNRFQFHATGCQISLNDGYKLSIQTDPSIAGDSFAETALLSTKKGLVYGPCGYDDVKRFDTPEELYKEIEWLLTQNISEE